MGTIEAKKKEAVSAGTIARTVLLILALLNQALAISGHSPLPFDDETVTQFISLGATMITAGISWWKNNSFTKSAIQADEFRKEIKGA